MQINIGRLDIM